jgi:hypothetical protein
MEIVCTYSEGAEFETEGYPQKRLNPNKTAEVLVSTGLSAPLPNPIDSLDTRLIHGNSSIGV